MTKERGTTTARSGLRLRDSPRDGATLSILSRGTNVEILGRETWLRVKSDGKTGFVLADYVEPAENNLPTDAQNIAVADPDDAASAGALIITYTSEQMKGEVIRIDKDFKPAMDKLAQLCQQHELVLHITSSLREPHKPVSNGVVESATLSNHHVGHAIDMNIIADGLWFNSKKLAKFEELPKKIQQFLDALPDIELRWGGKFSTPDPVHIDDGLNLSNSAVYGEKLLAIWQQA